MPTDTRFSELPIYSTDPRTVPEEELRPFHAFGTLLEEERSPDDPTTPWEVFLAGLHNIPSFVELGFWHIRLPDGRVAATADCGVLTMDNNQHLAQFGIQVLPELRQQGLGRRLLREVVTMAEQKGRRLLISNAVSTVPAGAAFLERVGAHVGLQSHTNQLRIADLDRNLLARWIAESPAGFEPGWWDGPYPEEEIEQIVGLNELMNQAPREDLEVDDFHWTAEHLREQEKAMAARGGIRWTVFARESGSGKFAGYTQLFWNPHKPLMVNQGITGVWPEHRGKGIGRWLKAAMLDRLLRERPEVTIVRTENADSNVPMLKINTELGFKPYRADSIYQMDVARVREYLDS